MSFSFGVESVYAAQRCSRELSDSVWSVRFYEHLLDVLANDTWRSYPSEAFGRPCQFERLTDFLVSPDGLGWPAVRQVLKMIEIVARCDPPPPPRQNEPTHPPITKWAAGALEALEPHLTALSAAAETVNPLAGHGVRQTEQQRNPETGLFMAAQEAQLQALAKHGGAPRPEGPPRVDSVNSGESKGGNRQTYLLRRLARDAPDVLERVKAGEFRSARAAAIEAGIIKPVPTIRVTSDMQAVAAKLCQHLTREQRIQLIDLLAPDA